MKLRQVKDVVSNTICGGEKYIPASQYGAGTSNENYDSDQGWDCAYDVDNIR